MMQNVQRWSQPFWICMKARAREPKPSIMADAVSRTDMMSLTMTRGLPATLKARNVSARIFSALPMTASTSAMPAKRPGSTWAAQPVTTMRAPGRSRRSLRMVCAAWRTASAVTAQVLTITVSSRPAACACRRMASDS